MQKVVETQESARGSPCQLSMSAGAPQVRELGGWLGSVTAIERTLVAVFLGVAVSLAVTVKVDVSPVVGVPENAPAVDILIPAGSPPSVMAYVTVPLPPAWANDAL
jgi:hypothetical protein